MIGNQKLNILSDKRKKLIILSISAVLLLCLGIGTTVAWLTSTTGDVKNTFTPGEVTCEVVENISGVNKTSVKIKNTGNIDAYIRAAVIANSVNEGGNVTGAADISSALAAEGWVKNGDFYYWNEAVEPEGLTGELLKESIDLTGIQVVILAEAVQSKPDKAVKEAWGIEHPFTE